MLKFRPICLSLPGNYVYRTISYVLIALVSTASFAVAVKRIQTPLAEAHFQNLPSSKQIESFLHQLANQSSLIKVVPLGKSAGGRNTQAVLISNDPQWLEHHNVNTKLTALLIGSQHGSEAAGCEALQLFIKKLAHNQYPLLLNDLNLIIIVNANPDGRDMRARFNASHININIDFIALKSPEAEQIVNLLETYQPDALLDLHESSIYKRILSGEQGFMTTVMAQYEVGNNPNINRSLLNFTQQIMLPALIQRTTKNGLSSQHYRGEILQLGQPVSHGGLHITNLRNYSALKGVASFLVENRLDPLDANYPTWMNIKERRQRQLISIESFLQTLIQYKEELKRTVRAAKNSWKTLESASLPIFLKSSYELNKVYPLIDISLQEIKSQQFIMKQFPNYDVISSTRTSQLVRQYVLTGEAKRIRALLTKHHILTKPALKDDRQLAVLSQIKSILIHIPAINTYRTTYDAGVNYFVDERIIKKGDFLLSTSQANGRLAALLLEPESMDSLYQELAFRPLLLESKEIMVFSTS